MPPTDDQREKNIAAKDAARKAKNDEIAAKKKALQAEREKEALAKATEEDTAQQKKMELEAKRDANVAGREKNREVKKVQQKGGSSKYGRKDVLELKKVFDEYDKDGSGEITLDEFTKSMKEKKVKNQPRPGEKSTLAQRRANEGVSILDVSDSVFSEMDDDKSGSVTFTEMLKLMFPLATPSEVTKMLSFVAPEPEPEPEPKPELSAEALKSINGIFKLYDKDKSGALTFKELKIALEKTGIDPDEIKGYFTEYDQDENGEINKDEFMKLMESTGAFDEM